MRKDWPVNGDPKKSGHPNVNKRWRLCNHDLWRLGMGMSLGRLLRKWPDFLHTCSCCHDDKKNPPESSFLARAFRRTVEGARPTLDSVRLKQSASPAPGTDSKFERRRYPFPELRKAV